MFPGHEESSSLVIICCICACQWFSANSFTPIYKPWCLPSIIDFCRYEGYLQLRRGRQTCRAVTGSAASGALEVVLWQWRLHPGACSAQSLYRGTECETELCPSEENVFLGEAVSAKMLITTMPFMTSLFTAKPACLFAITLNPCLMMYFLSFTFYLLVQLVYWLPLTIQWYI